MNVVNIESLAVGDGQPLAFIAGPCVLEDERTVLATAETLARIAQDLKIGMIFKSSYEKDNRSTSEGFRGPGLARGLELLARVREATGLPVMSDVHRESDVAEAAAALDVVQIPAFLCQQTSLLLAVGRYARVVNIKKGQFLAPEAMSGPVEKVRAGGCRQILLTERGSCFGYGRLVSDLTCVPVLQGLGCPVVYDASHIVRRYGVPSSSPEGGQPALIPLLARAGVAAGADVLFIETHPEPARALCDAASMLPLADFHDLARTALAIAASVRPGLRREAAA